MFAIFKRELRSYFTSLVGYVVIGVMLAFIGLYYSANCLVYGTSDFSTVLYSTTLVMLFLLPALTMRSFADERRNKTDQLLLTSPVGIPSIVMGKYFAQLAVFAVPMAAAAIMPLVLTAFGTISLTSAYATWLAYFLMGAACCAWLGAGALAAFFFLKFIVGPPSLIPAAAFQCLTRQEEEQSRHR